MTGFAFTETQTGVYWAGDDHIAYSLDGNDVSFSVFIAGINAEQVKHFGDVVAAMAKAAQGNADSLLLTLEEAIFPGTGGDDIHAAADRILGLTSKIRKPTHLSCGCVRSAVVKTTTHCGGHGIPPEEPI